MKTRALAMMGLVLGMLAACGGSGNGVTTGGGTGGGTDGGPGGGTDGGSPNVGAEAGIAKGMVLDTRGSPLRGAEVKLCEFPAVSFCASQNTGADGRYSLVLSPGRGWSLYGYVRPQYNGRNYCLELQADTSGVFTSATGVIRNFQWNLVGLKPDASDRSNPYSYYGAYLEVIADDIAVPINPVEITGVPQGPLVDGSTGQTFTISTATGGGVFNIPLGRYLIAAAYAPPGGPKSPLKIRISSGALGPSAVVDFEDQDCILQPKVQVWVAP